MAKLEKLNKYQLILITLIVIFIIITLSTIIASKIKMKSQDIAAIVTTEGELAINYVDGQNIILKDKKNHEYNITITNTSEQIIYYSINIENQNNETTSAAYLYNENQDLVYQTDDVTNDKALIELVTIAPSETIRYKLIMKNNKKENFNGIIKVLNDSMTTQTFADLILLNNSIKNSKSKIGLEIATLDEGLINSQDNYGTTYFFRGNVKDNYVQVGKNIFRIVRINGDGSVRLVLNDFLNQQLPYNTQTNYENVSQTANLLNTSLLNELNTWYENNLSEYKNSLIAGAFCTDTTFNTQVGDIYYSDTYNRIYASNNPTLVCQGTLYNSYIGLLSVDEIIFAGAYKNTPNKEYYLYNKSQPNTYLTNSSYSLNSSNTISMININADGSLGNGALSNIPQAIRPVINVSTSAKVKGRGTLQSPYIIVG